VRALRRIDDAFRFKKTLLPDPVELFFEVICEPGLHG
jgi:hypothetical protein